MSSVITQRKKTMTELRVRVKPIVKKKLEEFKDKTGLSINYIVNWCLVKFMILENLMSVIEYNNEVDIYEPENPRFSEVVNGKTD